MKDKRLIIIFFTVFIDLVGFGIIIPMNPYLAEKFGASPLQVGLLLAIYSLMQFFFVPMWGQLSDRIGRRPVILISLLGAAISHMGFAFATAFWGLMLARGFAGLFGGNVSTAMAYMADITEEKDRSKGMALIGVAFGLGFILGPALGGILAQVGGHLGAYPPLGQSFPAVVASAICFVNFLFALKELPETEKHVNLHRYEFRFRRITRALTTPVLSLLMILVFLNIFAMANIEASLFLFVQDRFHWSLSEASFGFAYIGVIMVFTQGYLIRKWIPRYGEKRLLAVGFTLAAIGFALCGISEPHLWVLALGVTTLGLGNGLASPSLNGSVSLASAADSQGNNLGVSQSLSSLGRIVGPVVGGAFYQQIGVWSPFIASAMVVAVACLLVLTRGKNLPNSGKLQGA